jgi:L-serine dehydratase
MLAPMSTFSLFDIAGPIMVGPSSSHTAGAAKIGQFARAIFDATPTKVHFLLHGSFGEVYKGHATDKALLGGVMKFAPNDARIKEAFEIAAEKGLEYQFEPGNLGAGFHPNSVKITLENPERKMELIGSSIGGGNIVMTQINGFDVHLTGNGAEQYFTLVTENENRPGMLAKITGFLGEKGIRIVNMQSCYLAFENKVLSVLSIETPLTLEDLLDLEKCDGILFARSLNKIAP